MPGIQARQYRFAATRPVENILLKLGRAEAPVAAIDFEKERSSGRLAMFAHPFEQGSIQVTARGRQVIGEPATPTLREDDYAEPVRPERLGEWVPAQPPGTMEAAARIHGAVFIDRAAALPAKTAGDADADLLPAYVRSQPTVAARGARPTTACRVGNKCRIDMAVRGGWRRTNGRRRGYRDHGSTAVLVSFAAATGAGFIPCGRRLHR